MDLNQTSDQMEMFGYTAEGAQQEADKFVGEAGNLEEDISKAASSLVPFYDSGVNIVNVAQEYMKPEEKRDYDYIKSQFTEAGQSAAIEGGLLLMGGVAGKYGAKGIKALADKVKQYEIDSTAMSAFGAGAIKKKSSDAEKALAMLESQDLRDAWVKNKRKELGISDTDKDYSARDLVSKQEIKRRQTRKFPEQIKDLESGKMSGPEYRRYIRENQPATKFNKEDLQTMLTSFEDMVGGLDALGQNKASKGIIGLTDNVEKGTEVAARLDIPAYNKRDIWVAQITGAGKNMYGRTAVLKDVKFFIEGKDAARKSKKMREVGKGERDKSPFATMKGEWQGISDEESFKRASELIDDPEWIQVGFNPERHSFFYDKDTMMPVFEADEVIQVGPLVLAKKAKLGNKRINPETGKEMSFIPADRIEKIRELKIEDKPTVFKQGGMAMKDDMNMGYALGGEVDAIDPVSGNEIPPGSTAKEVRDDIPAMLSEGEYVVPADVLKFYGLKFFEDLRQKAKVEMAMLEEDGRMGGQPTPEGDDLTEDEMRLLDEVMGMAQGGMAQMQPQQPQPPQPMMMGQQMPPPKPQPTEYNKPVGFNTGGMTDAFGNPIGPTVEPAKTPDKFLEDIDPTSTNVYGIDKEGTGTDSSTNLAQEDIGVKTPTDQVGTGDGSGMKTVFYFHKDGRRIQVLMLNGKPISSVPADFSEFKEDTPENRTPDPTPEDPIDDIGGGVGKTKSAGGGGSDDDERRVQAKTIETLKTNAEKKRIENFNNTLATGSPEDILKEYKKAKTGQGASFLLPGLIGVAGAGLAKKNLNTIEAAYLKRSKDMLGDAFNLEEAQKTLDDISIGSATMDGISGTFEGKDGKTAMSNLFGKGFYDNYEAKYDVSEYIGMGSSISGAGVKGFVQGGYGNLDARQQQHFDNAVDRGDSAILNHFSLVATSNRAKDDFAIKNADDIQDIQNLMRKGDKESLAEAKILADVLKRKGHSFGNMSLGNSSMDEVIRLGSSANTANRLGKAKKEKGFFSKTVTTGDNSPIRTTEPVKDSGPTAQEKADAAKEAADRKKAADDAAAKKKADDARKKAAAGKAARLAAEKAANSNSSSNNDFHSQMVASAQKQQVAAGQQAGKGYVGGFGFDKGGLMKRKK